MSEEKKSMSSIGNSEDYALLLAITGGVHTVAPVSERPEVTLGSWTLVEVTDDKELSTLHAYGWDMDQGGGRACSAIKEISKSDGLIKFKTASGRVYSLSGSPGKDSDASYVWNTWKRINHIVSERDISNEYYSRQ